MYLWLLQEPKSEIPNTPICIFYLSLSLSLSKREQNNVKREKEQNKTLTSKFGSLKKKKKKNNKQNCLWMVTNLYHFLLLFSFPFLCFLVSLSLSLSVSFFLSLSTYFSMNPSVSFCWQKEWGREPERIEILNFFKKKKNLGKLKFLLFLLN